MLDEAGITDKELSALLAGELLVPVVHGTSCEELREASPLLASRSGLSTKENTMAEIAVKISELVSTDAFWLRGPAGGANVAPAGRSQRQKRAFAVEGLHIAVAGTGTLAVHPQPTLDVILILILVVTGLLGILRERLGPHLARQEVDPSTTVHRVTLQHVGEFLQIHR